MIIKRDNSLSKIDLRDWIWTPFFNDLVDKLSVFEIEPYPVSHDFLSKESITGSRRNPVHVTTLTWAAKFEKIKQVRLACIKGGESLSVFNLLIHPLNDYDLPFFGADFVTLPNGHLLALDLQPALKLDNIHTENVWPRLIPLHDHWQSLLPSGGEIPKEAEPYFSPGFLWSRLPLSKESDNIISEILRPAFGEYLSLYIELLHIAKPLKKERALKILEGQKAYINYRSTKDPARAMLCRFYGKEWTEDYIHKVLFNI
ncbi:MULTISPECIES: phycoerythrobilin:ferredoxin oxidoreductase [Prochlorococcus]|uniref:Phycoerythrobilin:ferredoxin oxidoreductase n=1 Tax=Prochlorococcus marinus (strain SARG / CCMP1375 / SS120) TaxID=167539 RepID=PEBB_PROMA|nr:MULTISPECIES: phycoerythrobilin:ferredoxin oxidoreductase [Prochlorococcus]Q9K4U5.1 RecName: Full=Phycoerythrobilin:ferredoxin oxidoreductase [Prochlorococcus marinus subsp. marinus str. CCMP1375]CAB95701.1 hypothetical protein [Prochlorococcus marinus]AAQ00792.1 Phycoerythrobilin:ferredoxin oxidoreductase PebB [Prochlorococcus marinus subsp. marinus str. CCMP1375]KGG10714.1 Phycoerythrobilin:ferredoxin oxidoreductase PebB [Prochlorococcus marinus str. LG]KGG21135.1 Phycoerythrobilin:ferred